MTAIIADAVFDAALTYIATNCDGRSRRRQGPSSWEHPRRSLSMRITIARSAMAERAAAG